VTTKTHAHTPMSAKKELGFALARPTAAMTSKAVPKTVVSAMGAASTSSRRTSVFSTISVSRPARSTPPAAAVTAIPSKRPRVGPRRCFQLFDRAALHARRRLLPRCWRRLPRAHRRQSVLQREMQRLQRRLSVHRWCGDLLQLQSPLLRGQLRVRVQISGQVLSMPWKLDLRQLHRSQRGPLRSEVTARFSGSHKTRSYFHATSTHPREPFWEGSSPLP
jgi:hypothetical protein